MLEIFGETLLRGIDLLVGAVADGYSAVDRESMARDAEIRRGLLEDVLNTAPPDPVAAAPRRRLADRFGLDPDAAYRVIAMTDSRTDPDRSLEDGAHALSRRLRRPSRSTARAATFPLPQVLAWRGLVVVLASASWPAAAKLPPHLDWLLGPDWIAVAGAPARASRGSRRPWGG